MDRNAPRDRRDEEITRPIPISYRTSAGLTLVGQELGPKRSPTVVLLHGGGQTRHSWSMAARRLAGHGYHVISYDARGHGNSEWSADGDYSLAALASDLRAVLATLTGAVVLVGASMGGITGFYAAGTSDRPIADGLVLVDIVLHPAAAGQERIRRFMGNGSDGFANLDEAVAAVAAYNPNRGRPIEPERLRRNMREGPDGRLFWHWDPGLIRSGHRVNPRGPAEELVAVAAGVTLPTLLVRGELSDMVDDEGVAQMRRLVPQLEVSVVAGAGHMVVGDRNDAFIESVLAFLHRHLPIPHESPR